jgi:RNA polymerase sigma-70 factor (ECF subfamily)
MVSEHRKNDFDRSDSELVEVIQTSGVRSERAREASEVLFARYRRKVYLFCYRYVADHEAALDAAQEVLLKAYEGLARFDRRASFSCWLFTIARNHCLNLLRSNRRWVDIESVEQWLFDEIDPPDRAVEVAERERRLLDLIENHLDPVEQKAVWLRYVEWLPVPEITRVLELTEKSGARAVLQRARRKLRRALEAKGGEWR